MDAINSKNVIEGVVIGITSGLVVSAILGIRHFIGIRFDRYRQIKRLREVIVDFRERIFEIEERIRNAGNEPGLEQKQMELLLSMLGALNSAVENFGSNLSYIERLHIENVVSYRDRTFYDIGLYNEVFDRLEQKDWLKLPALNK